MSDTVTELSLRWKRAPDAESTIALANAVRGAIYASLIQEVGAFASDRLGSDVPVLLAVSRMYLSAHRLSDAQALLVAAGKISPREARVYALLGEVLLRRGDADRAEKVLERAMQLGSTDAATRRWLDRARTFKPMQSKLGGKTVAAEVERTAPAVESDLVPVVDPPSERTLQIGERANEPGAASRLDSSDVLDGDDDDEEPPTAIRVQSELVAPSSRRPPVTAENPLGGNGSSVASSLTPAGMPKQPPAFYLDKKALSGAGFAVEDSVTFDLASHGQRNNNNRAIASPMEIPVDGSVQVAEPPRPRELLEALAHAGVYDARPDQKIEWVKPARESKRRGSWLLAVATILFIVGAGATYRYVEQLRTLRRTAAESLMAEIETGLIDGRTQKLPDLERAFSRAFELDSRSQRAAIAWARERALVGLLKGGQDVAFEDATSRARAVGIKESDLAFTQLASFLFQNDNAGAVSLLARHDDAAKSDPWYQLLAGTCLERLGDARAVDRYAAAVKLSPEFVPAEIALTRYEILEGDRARAAELVAQFRARHGDRPEGMALAALLWARDTAKPKVPTEIVALASQSENLPLTLAAVPHAVAARLALEKSSLPEARDAIRRGLAAADGPGVASWLGFLALEADDEPLARKAALSAVAYSALYPRARSLAARVALLSGRLDEALKATEELDPSAPDVALARAIVAYERADSDGLARAIEALPAEKRSSQGMASMALATGALVGRVDIPPSKIAARATAEELWSDVVAMDIALDSGNLDAASAIGNRWLSQTKPENVAALKALRLARLARYQSRLDDAEALSSSALAGATPTLRSVAERAYVLIAREKPTEVGPLLSRNASAISGPLSSWLGAYAQASNGKIEDARGRSSSLDPPPDTAPLPVRMLVASSLGAMRDKKRGVPVIDPLLAKQGNPDVIAAAQGVGLRPPTKK